MQGGWGPGDCWGWASVANLDNISYSLNTLNSNVDYDLTYVHELFFGDYNDENSFFNDNHSDVYYDLNSFSDKFNSKNIIFLSLNVCSLMSKHQSLTTVIL